MAIQRFKLDLVPGHITPHVHVSQYDEGVQRCLYAELYWDGTPYTVNSNATAEIHGTNRRGHGFDSDCEIDRSGTPNVVIIEPELKMTYISGAARCKVEVKAGTSVIGTGAFILDVDPAGRDDDTPVITDEQNVLDVNAAITAAQAAQTDAEIAQAGAVAAQTGAETAQAGAVAAQEAAESAAEFAENAVVNAQFAEFTIADDGHLYMETSDNYKAPAFALNDGRLEMTIE